MTLKQIAEQAGVHISTVDKVIHNRGGVSQEVANNIRRIIKELDYKTNPTGRALQKSGKIYNIAVLLATNDSLEYLRDGIRKEIHESAFRIQTTYVVTGVLDGTEQAEAINRIIDQKTYDAIIITAINSESVRQALNRAAENGIPSFTVNSDIRGSRRLCFIGQYGEQEAVTAGKVMGTLMRGSGKLAVVTSTMDPGQCDLTVKLRESRFGEYLKRHYPNMQIVQYIECFEDRIIAKVKTEKLLAGYPDLEGMYITCGCVNTISEVVRDTGKKDQIVILGYEDYPEILELINEGVINVTIAGDLLEQGRICVRMMMDYLVHGKLPEETSNYMDARILFKECICDPAEV